MQEINSKFQKYLKSGILKLDGTLLALLPVGLVFAVFTLTYSQAEDMGQFLSQTAALVRGHHLYRDIWEVKDPLFFVIATLSTFVFGRGGPYIADALAVALSAPVSYLALKSMNINKQFSAIGAIIFVGSLSGAYFQSFRTGTICIVVLLLSMISMNKGKLFLTGVFFAIVVLLKMPYVPFLVCPLVMGAGSFRSKRNSYRITFGFLLTLIFVFGLMQLRGELFPYFEMVKSNFKYRETYPSIVGFRPGLAGYIDTVNGNGSSFSLLLATAAGSWLFIKRKNPYNSRFFIGMLSLQMAVLFVILTSAMWVHHLQILCLFGFATYAIVVSSATDTFLKSGTKALVAFLLVITSISITGFNIPFKPQLEFSEVIDPKWTVPPEILYINKNVRFLKAELEFARLGPNDDFGLFTFLPNNWKLVCPEFAQYGHEDADWIADIANCLDQKPAVVIVSPGFFALSRASGDYEILKNKAQNVLDEKFNCVEVEERPGAFICERLK